MNKRYINGTLAPLTTTTTSDHTVNYDLPLWQGQDVTSWLTQLNDAMDKIDSGIYESATKVEGVHADVEEAKKIATDAADKVDAATELIPTLQTDITTLQTDMAQAQKDILALQTSATDQDREIHSLQDITDSMMDDISTHADNISTLTSAVRSNETSITTAAKAVEALNTQIQDIETEVNKWEPMYAKGDLMLSNVSTPFYCHRVSPNLFELRFLYTLTPLAFNTNFSTKVVDAVLPENMHVGKIEEQNGVVGTATDSGISYALAYSCKAKAVGSDTMFSISFANIKDAPLPDSLRIWIPILYTI